MIFWKLYKLLKIQMFCWNVLLKVLSMLLGTLGASLLGNLLTVKGFERVGSGNHSKKGKGVVRAG